MAINLDSLYSQNTVADTGVGKEPTGEVIIQSSDNQPVQIQTSSDATAIQVNDDATIQLNLGLSVNEISNIWNPAATNFAKQLFNGPAIQAALDQNSGGLQFFDFNTKALYDARVWVESETPNFTFINDTVAFNFTDTEGKSVSNVDWVMVLHHWHAGAIESHILFSSDDAGQLTASEIASLYHTVANEFTNTYKAQLDNAPVNINTSLSNLQSSITTNSNNIQLEQQRIGVNEDDILDLQNDKYDKSGGTITGSVVINNTDLQINNPGTGNGYLNFYNSSAATNQRNYKIIPTTAETLDIDCNNDVGTTLRQFRFYHNGNLEVPSNITQNGNAVLDVGDYSLIKSGLEAIANTNFVTDSELTAIGNLPADTTSQLSGKLSNSGDTITGDLTIQNKTLKLNATTNGEGDIEFYNTTGAVDLRKWKIFQNSNGSVRFRSVTDSGAAVQNIDFNHNGSVDIPGQITQGGDIVLDSTDITSDINDQTGKAITAEDAKAYIDANSGSFDGGTINNTISVKPTTETKSNVIIKRHNNAFDSGVSWQNSGNNFTKCIYQDQSDSDKLKIATGNSADINALIDIVEISNSVVEVNSHLHTNGDVFCFNGGNMAASNITSVGDFIGTNIRINGSETDTNWAIYKSAQGNTAGIGGTKAADGRSFSGQALRLRVANSTDQGLIVENGIGLNLFEVNGSTGIVTTANNHDILGSLETHGDSNFRGKLAVGANANPANALDVYGALYVTGDALFKSTLAIEDSGGHDHIFEPRAEGIALRTESNPASGEPIFLVESSGGGVRLRVEHSGAVSTTNDFMKVGTENDGTGGRFLLEEGNWALIQHTIHYEQDFPSLSTTDIVGWSGRRIVAVGIGAGTFTMPSIVEDNPSASQFKAGETFEFLNYNSGSNITFSAASGQKWMIDNVDSGNISTGNFTVFASSKVVFKALDLRNYSNVSAFCWAVTGY